jgi:hypothetical protein
VQADISMLPGGVMMLAAALALASRIASVQPVIACSSSAARTTGACRIVRKHAGHRREVTQVPIHHSEARWRLGSL